MEPSDVVRTEQLLAVGPHRLESIWLRPTAADPSAPVLVFLHAGLSCAALWRDFPERLVEATGLSAFVYSRAGHGRSSAISLPRPVRYMHDEALLLPHVLAAAGIGESILVGHSDGGSIAILAAGNAGTEVPPLRVRALLLEAPHLFAEAMGLESIAKMRDSYLTTDLRERLGKHHRAPDQAFWGWCGPWLDPGFRSWNIEPSLRSITAPIFVVQGEDDEYGTSLQLEALRRGARGPLEVLLLPQCGHAPHKDQPAAVTEAMRAFVARVLARPPR